MLIPMLVFVWGALWVFIVACVHKATDTAWRTKYIKDLKELRDLATEAFDNYKGALASQGALIEIKEQRIRLLEKEVLEKKADIEKLRNQNIKLN
jgi:hypothetical protein